MKNEKQEEILIIDDDETLCAMYTERLKAAGFQVKIANNGEEGLEKIRELKPDLILLDIMMPKVNGYEVFEEVKNDESISNIPVIFLTALIKDEKKLEELETKKGEEVEYIHKSEIMPGEVTKMVKEKLSS